MIQESKPKPKPPLRAGDKLNLPLSTNKYQATGSASNQTLLNEKRAVPNAELGNSTIPQNTPMLGAGISNNKDNMALCLMFIFRSLRKLSQFHDVEFAGAEVGDFFYGDQIVASGDVEFGQVAFGEDGV